jgi:ribosomal protein L11 methyltransferase
MMIESMRNIDFAKKRVLDLGCGTGILSVLAAKLGSNQVTAVDIEEESVENTLENLTLNNTTANVKLGSVDVLKGEAYDVILANINRNAIMFLIEDIVSLMNPGSTVLFSGFLEQNFEEVKDKADTFGLELQSRKQRGEWECLQFALIKN